MRHIDAFCHFFPHSLFEKMSQTTGGTKDIGKRMQSVRTIHDLDARLKMMDEFADYSQVLSLGLPPIEGMVEPDKAPDAAAKEAERARIRARRQRRPRRALRQVS